MAVRPKTSGPSLFAAAGLDKDAPRPLADKLRPLKALQTGLLQNRLNYLEDGSLMPDNSEGISEQIVTQVFYFPTPSHPGEMVLILGPFIPAAVMFIKPLRN